MFRVRVCLYLCKRMIKYLNDIWKNVNPVVCTSHAMRRCVVCVWSSPDLACRCSVSSVIISLSDSIFSRGAHELKCDDFPMISLTCWALIQYRTQPRQTSSVCVHIERHIAIFLKQPLQNAAFRANFEQCMRLIRFGLYFRCAHRLQHNDKHYHSNGCVHVYVIFQLNQRHRALTLSKWVAMKSVK